MAADHTQPTVDEGLSPELSPTLEFVLIMVITGVVAFGGVAFLTF